MAITKTVVRFLNNNANFEFNEDKTVDFVRSAFSGTFEWLSNAAVTETVEGGTKTITFSERTGTKG
jgi:hypothetical protein